MAHVSSANVVAYVGAAASGLPRLAGRLSGWWAKRELHIQFVIVASVVVTAFMTVLGAWVSDRIVKGIIANSAANAALYLHGFVEPYVQELPEAGKLSAATIDRLDAIFSQQTMLRDRIASIKIWAPGGRVVYAKDHRHIGHQYPETAPLREAWQGHVATEFDDLSDEENQIERRFNVPILEIYSPVFRASDNAVIAVAEIYQVAQDLRREMRASYIETAATVGGLTLVLIASLFQIVRRGAQTISQQKSSLSIRVEELSRTLAINRFLQRKVTQANQRAVSANEQFLRQIGAELHDGPAQLISLGLLRLDGLRPRAGGAARPPEAVEHDFSIIRGALSDSLKEVRSICAGMTIPELNDCTLAQAIELSVTMHERRSGSTVALDLDDRLPDGMPLPFVICAYRFVQEGLNNAFKHAGGAGQRVSARMAGTHVVLTVSDSGPGITRTPADTVSSRLGLRGLTDRIRAMGGELNIRSAPGEGTHLEARFNIEDLGLGHD